MPHNRPVVHEEQVGDTLQSQDRLLLVSADRLVRDVAAGGHHRHSQLAHKQMMQRCVRQHHAEVGISRRDRCRQIVPSPRRSSTIGASGERSSRSSIAIDDGVLNDLLQ